MRDKKILNQTLLYSDNKNGCRGMRVGNFFPYPSSLILWKEPYKGDS